MSDGYERGIVIDARGFFVAALRWRVGDQPPAIPGRFRNGRENARPSDVIILREDYAVENVSENARWDFQPVFDGGVPIRSGSWTFPTSERWLVIQRRDLQTLWTYSRRVLVWPDALPTLPDGQRLIDVPPPALSRAVRPAWDDVSGGWLEPRTVLALAADGEIINRAVAYRDDDLPPADEVIDDDPALTGLDEIGEAVRPEVGDRIITGGASPVVEIRRPPAYRAVPPRLLRDALDQAGQLQAFLDFLTVKGFTSDQLSALPRISLRNKLLREFVVEQGFTLAQAYNQIQRVAEQALEDEETASNSLGAEE